MDNLIVFLGAGIIFLAVVALFVFLETLVIHSLWGLVLVPVFHLPSITMLQAFGIACILDILRRTISVTVKKEK
jgi:hypothetical protein